MMYWLGVYVLVVIGVAVPFLLLYLVGLLLCLAAAAIRSDPEPNGCLSNLNRLFKSTVERRAPESGVISDERGCKPDAKRKRGGAQLRAAAQP